MHQMDLNSFIYALFVYIVNSNSNSSLCQILFVYLSLLGKWSMSCKAIEESQIDGCGRKSHNNNKSQSGQALTLSEIE